MATSEKILELLKAGDYAAQIAKKLNISEARVSYLLKQMRKKGIIKITGRSSVKFYDIQPVKLPVNLTVKLPSLSHIPKSEAPQAKLQLRLHRMMVSYPILNAISEQKLEGLKKSLLNNNHQWIGNGFRITSKNLELEGIQLWSHRHIEAAMLEGLAYGIADNIASNIAKIYGFSIDLKTRHTPLHLTEIELTEQAMAERVKEKGIIGLHWPKDSIEPDIWMDKSFGMGGLESNIPEYIQKLTDFTNLIVENRWDGHIQLQLNQNILEALNELKEIQLKSILDIKELQKKVETKSQ